MSYTLNISGNRFGRLVALRPTKKRRSGSVVWCCKCDCGNITFVSVSTLRDGITKSCGCLREDLSRIRYTIHGFSGSREYKIWTGIKSRCYDKNHPVYNNYGGRGIKVCKSWKNSFSNFLEDMGLRPSPKLSIERIDNDKGYCWYNCKCATCKEQANNRRKPIARRAIKMIRGFYYE